MADNIVDAVADVVEGWGRVNARVWADEGPNAPTFPYVTVDDAITLAPDLKGDARTIRLVRQVQVNLWERLDEEDPDLAATLWVALDGRVVVLTGGQRIRLAADSSARLPEIGDNIAHRALTLSARHDPAVP